MNIKLTNEQWQKILPVLQSCSEIQLGSHYHLRRFLAALFWITRSGSQWRLLPKEYGKWNTVYKRFARWSTLGIFEKLFEQISKDRDLEYLLIDSTVVRSHAGAAGAQKNMGNKH